jgi:hypothetical protein
MRNKLIYYVGNLKRKKDFGINLNLISHLNLKLHNKSLKFVFFVYSLSFSWNVVYNL